MIHIAGFPVRVGNQKRQLCAWCGERLIDDNLEAMASSDGEEPGHFEPNALVEVSGQNPRCTSIVPHVDGAAIPTGWCGDEKRPQLRLVKES